MKRLSRFSVISFVGPFIITLALSMFILIMQFFWKYIDDLMGKGIETIYIVELLFYVSASLIPLALPLAMLLSSIMTIGNLSENNELTALKASGLSLYRILRPYTALVLIIAMATFLFANYVIPVANYKWRSLIYDFQNTKIASIIVPGVYTRELEGYAIKANEKLPDGTFVGLTIHDKTGLNQLKTVKAERANLYKSDNGKYLFFNLKNGHIIEEMMIQAPIFDSDGNRIYNESSTRETRRSTFEQATYKIDLVGFKVERSDDEGIRDDYEMLTVFQIKSAIKEADDKLISVKKNFSNTILSNQEYFQAKKHILLSDSLGVQNNDTLRDAIKFAELTASEKNLVYSNVTQNIQSKITTLESQDNYFNSIGNNRGKYLIEFHKKIALTYAIIVLFFVGAPLGAIIRKGGFGAPVVIAALLFMLYFVLITIGESLAVSGAVSPFVGMWFSSFILTPVALVLLYAAANDLPIMDRSTWASMFRFLKFKR